MAIGTGDFTAKQKRGFIWKFGIAEEGATWELIEPLLISYLQELGKDWNKMRSQSTAEFNDGLMLIVDKLKEDPENMDSVKTLLGL